MTNEEKIKELQESIYLIERGADRLTVRDKERIAELKRQINELRPKEQGEYKGVEIPKEKTPEHSLNRISSGELNAPKDRVYGKL